jgi:hypothetical protein
VQFILIKPVFRDYLSYCPPPPQSRAGDMEMLGICPLVCPSEICCKCFKIVFVDQMISNLHTSIILGISSLSSKLGKIKMSAKTRKNFKVLLFQRKLIFRRFWPEECDSNKCDLRIAAIAAIIMGILAVIFNMVTKTHKQFRSAPMLQLQRKFYIFSGF